MLVWPVRVINTLPGGSAYGDIHTEVDAMKRIMTAENRKAAAQRLAEIIGETCHYTKVPRCAYEVGPYMFEKDGSITLEEDADLDPLRQLVREGLVTPFEKEVEVQEEQTEQEEPETAEATDEPCAFNVRIPTAPHTGNTLRNLVYLIYTRGELINKALGTSFSAEKGLVDELADKVLITAKDLIETVTAYEETYGRALSGLTITEEMITFSSLPETTDGKLIRAFMDLVVMMNKQALAYKRIQAKVVTEENEKYALRIWLTRLGMSGSDYKDTRRILLQNLKGDSAFHTRADKEKWKERYQKSRREVER